MSNVVKNEFVKKAVYDKLVAKVNNIDAREFVRKLENKIPDTNKLVKKSGYNAKISETEGKIPSISGLVTTSILTTVENNIPSVSNLVKGADCDTKN